MFARNSVGLELADITTLLSFTLSNMHIRRSSPVGDGTDYKHLFDTSKVEQLNIRSASVCGQFMYPNMFMSSDFASTFSYF